MRASDADDDPGKPRLPRPLLLAATLALLLLFPPAALATELPETIEEDTTLTEAGSPYTGNTVTIKAGVTVTAQAGVTVKVKQMVVNGTLSAEGTAESPVLFTSSKLFPSAGDWKGILINSGGGGSVLDHAEVRYAGSALGTGAIEVTGGASPTITNSTVRDSKYSGIKVIEGGAPTIAFDTLRSNGNYGVSYAAGESKTGKVNIHDNLVEGNTFAGISVSTSGSSVTGTSLGGNELIENEAAGLSYSGPDVPADIDENTLSKNKYNYVSVSGTVAGSASWEDRGYPFYLPTDLTIASAATLTLGAGITVTPYSVAHVVVDGTLSAKGTAESPVVFTSTEESPKPGDWKNIAFNSGSGESVLEYAEVLYAGASANQPAIEINGGVGPTIAHSTVEESKYSGIKVTEGGAPTIAYSTLRSNGGYGLSYVAGSSDTGKVNIHDNLAQGNSFAGISVSIAGTGVSATSLGENELVKNGGAGLSYTGPDVPPDIDDNTLSENSSNVMEVKGTLVQSASWKSRGYPFLITGELTIGSSATLTVIAGFTFKVAASAQIVVNGTLKAEGTAESPVLFTSSKESPKPGDWENIVLNAGSGESAIEYTEVLYGGSVLDMGAIEVKGGAGPAIKHTTIQASQYSGIKVTEGGAPEIAFDALLGNGNYGVSYAVGESKTGKVNIHDNLAEGNTFAGISVSTDGSSVTSTSLGDNVLVKNGGPGVQYIGPDVPPDLDENTLSGNEPEYIELRGTVAQTASWSDRGFPFYLSGELTIASAAALTLGAGIAFTPYSTSRIVVDGTLNAEGTAEDPVLFTSSKDLGPGDWKGILFNSGSGGSVLDHAVVRYAGSTPGVGAIEIDGSSPTITHSALRDNAYAGVKVVSGSPKVVWSSFTGNGSGLTYSGAGELSAPHNYWGCASGPAPSGCGNSVSENVDWKPQAEEDSDLGKCRGGETQCGEGADPVSLATGYLAYSHRDLLLTNVGKVPLEFVRSYSSGSQADTGLGPGWSQSGLATATEQEGGDVLVVRSDGRQDLFDATETGYAAPSGVTDVLSKEEDGTYALETLDRTVYDFDDSGRIASITDDHGLKTTYGYNESGRLATIADPSEQTLTFSYDESNHITAVKDSTEREVKYAYSEAGELASVTDALGGVTKYAYDSEHRLTSIVDPKENAILQNTYDEAGRIVKQLDGLENAWTLKYKEGETVVTEPEGGEIAYGFDSQDRVVSETDQLGKETTTAYDEAGNVKEVVRPGEAKWSFGHDGAGNLTSVKDPEGGERKYAYDGQNRLTSFTDARGKTWSYEWSEAGDLTVVTDPEEAQTTLSYDEAGLPLSVTDPAEHKTEFSYDARGNLLSTTDPLEHKTSFEYDSRNYLTARTLPGQEAAEALERNALGDLLAATTPEGHKTKYAYDANGMPTQVTDPAEGVWKITYNAMERPTLYEDPLKGKTEVSYNGNLRPTKVLDRRGKATTYGYDAANRLTSLKAPEEGNWAYGYDARGNRTSATDPREGKTTYAYDLADRLTEAKEPLEVTSKYEYDAAGNLTALTDPRGYATTYSYDDLGRLTAVKQPLEKTTSYAYDAAGNLESKTTAAGTLDYGYDVADRLTSIASGETTLRSYGYDAADRLTAATDAESHKIEIGYDEDGLPTSIKDGRGQTIARTYDSRGLLSKQEDGRGTISYGYDKLGRATSIADPQEGALAFAYDAEGNLTKIERPNGVDTTNVYDEAGRLSKATSESEFSITVEALEYAYDAAGNVTKRTDARLKEETTYAYDALNRLTKFDPPGEGSTTYAYDKAGNRTEAGETTYEFNALGQLTEASDGTAYAYDKAGRMTEMTKGEEETTYEWDLLDHLAKVEGSGGTVSYAFDALERLSDREDKEATRVIHYGDLGDLATYEADSEGETTISYLAGPGGLLEQRTNETAYPIADGHGDITVLTCPAGAALTRHSYDPWGAPIEDLFSSAPLEMGYLGAYERRADPATGLIQMGARSYAPELGAFLSEDPVLVAVGIGISANRYPYAWDNPLVLYDLDGRFPSPADVVGAVGDTAKDAVGTVGDVINAGRQSVSSAQEYWVESDSWIAPIAGSGISIVDLAVNPDRLDYYLKSNNLPNKEVLADCYRGGHPARIIGSVTGAIGGFGTGVVSAKDLGVRSAGVGAISGKAGIVLGGAFGTVGGCAVGIAGGYF